MSQTDSFLRSLSLSFTEALEMVCRQWAVYVFEVIVIVSFLLHGTVQSSLAVTFITLLRFVQNWTYKLNVQMEFFKKKT